MKLYKVSLGAVIRSVCRLFVSSRYWLDGQRDVVAVYVADVIEVLLAGFGCQREFRQRDGRDAASTLAFDFVLKCRTKSTGNKTISA